MEWKEALEIVMSRTAHAPFRAACDDSHAHHEIWRKKMVEKATGIISPPVVDPSNLPKPTYTFKPATEKCGSCGPPAQSASLTTQAKTAGTAIVRWATSGFRFSRAETQIERRAICEACEHRDPENDQCKICKCFLKFKLRLPDEVCPIGKWVAEKRE